MLGKLDLTGYGQCVGDTAGWAVLIHLHNTMLELSMCLTIFAVALCMLLQLFL